MCGNNTIIDDWVFFSCTSLTSIDVDVNNPNYTSIDGNLYSKDGKTLIQYAQGKTEANFKIPNGVTSTGLGTFSGCTSLVSVTISDSVTNIGKEAFWGCTSLTSVTFDGTKEKWNSVSKGSL